MTGDLDGLDDLAGEYVLGTLETAEREAVARRRLTDAALDAAILAWEARLDPLNTLAPPVEPSTGLLGRIERKIAQRPAAGATARQNRTPADNIVPLDLDARLRRWRAVALTTSALAASLFAVIVTRELAPKAPAQNFVAVFQKDDASPSFIMALDLTARTLTVRRVAAETPPGKTYELWIAAPTIADAPRSLGVVEGASLRVSDRLAAFDANVVQTALFGVSLEPHGGSPTGKPTGPVFHARLIPAAP